MAKLVKEEEGKKKLLAKELILLWLFITLATIFIARRSLAVLWFIVVCWIAHVFTAVHQNGSKRAGRKGLVDPL